jgi:hypothetical protein
MRKERFSGLPIPVHKIKADTPEEIFKEYPGLKRYFQTIPVGIKDLKNLPQSKTYAHWPGEVYGRLMRYIVFNYDPESDLIQEYPEDVRLRKEAALKEAGFKRRPDGEWNEYEKSIIDFREPQLVDFVLDYLKARKHYVWSEIVFVEEEIDLLNRKRAESIKEGKVTPELLKLTEERAEKRASLYRKFWANTGDLKENGEKKLYPISPENVFYELLVPDDVKEVIQVKDVS